MRRTAMTVLAAAGGLCVLVLVAVAIAVATIDLRTLVDPVLARVKAETGRALVVAGPIDLQLSFEPRIVLDDVSFGNAPWGAAQEMLRARRVEARVALLALLRRRVDVVELIVTEPRLALETDAQGRGNWELGAAAATAPPAAPASSAAGVLGVGVVTVDNGTVTYRDAVGATTTRVAIERLRVRTHRGDAPIDAEFRGKVDDIAVALSASLGPLDALTTGRWPVALTAKGEVDRRPAAMTAKLAVRPEAVTLDELDFTLGALKAKGQFAIHTSGKRRRYAFDLALPATALHDLAIVAAAARPSAPTGKAPASRYLFSEAPLPLRALGAVDAGGQLSIAELRIDERVKLAPLVLRVALDNGRLDVSRLSVGTLGGTIAGSATIDASRGDTAALALKLDSRDLDLGGILAAAGKPRQLRGGRTTLAVDLKASGASPHGWASTASGTVTAVVGPATLVNTKLDVDSALDQLARALNPFREVEAATELQCAVVRLPLSGGVARIDHSIAAETAKVGVSASGTLDFRNETLDLALRPQFKQGIPIDIPNIAGLVRYSGPFSAPRVTIDALASAELVAKIGAAVGTGGLSVLGSSLLAKTAGGEDACEIALGRRAPPPASARSPSRPEAGRGPALPEEIGKALGKLLGR
jgi:uncharacterized protein involved in outer membrane biogenesis